MTPILAVKADSFDARASTGGAGTPQAAAHAPADIPQRPTLESIIAEHEPRVRRLAQRLTGWSDDADDLVQDVFVAVLEHLPRFRGESSVATWVTAITLNRCRAWRRRKMLRRLFRSRAHASAMPEMPSAVDRLHDAERHERVRQAVRDLPPRDRELIVLRHLEQMELDDIAAVVGASRGAVEVRLHRARAKLKQALRDLVDET